MDVGVAGSESTDVDVHVAVVGRKPTGGVVRWAFIGADVGVWDMGLLM